MSLQVRLDAAARRGALTTADLAVWFDLPYQTVRSYRQGRRRRPLRSRRLLIETRLAQLERAVKEKRRFPVPLNVRQHERKKYLLTVLWHARRKR